MTHLRVLITGAGRGLGLELARSFLGRKARLWLVDLDDAALEVARRELGAEAGIKSSVCNIDLAADRRKVFEQVALEWGGLDVLVNNAGVFFGGAFDRVPIEQHLKTIDINLKAHIAMTHLFWPLLAASQHLERGLISIASSQSFVGVPLASSYAASKWGLLGFMESIRQECRRNQMRFRVLTVCPSTLDTRLFSGTVAPILMPVLEANGLAKKVVRAYKGGQSQLLEPFFIKLVPILVGAFPQWLSDFLIRLLRVDRALNKWDR
jgi:all-trans-retinol dehydrogenase (NAD+)